MSDSIRMEIKVNGKLLLAREFGFDITNQSRIKRFLDEAEEDVRNILISDVIAMTEFSKDKE